MSEISETEIKAMTKEQNYMRGYKDGKSDVLDKISAEIESKIIKKPYHNFTRSERDRNDAFLEIMEIVEKYKEASK